MEPNLAFTLGTASPHVVDIASAYSTFAAEGLQVKPTYIKLIKTTAGDTLYQYKVQTTQAFTPEVSATVTYALQQVVRSGTGTAAQALGRPCAGKTGTTNDNKSALFAGYTPQLAAAVMLTKDGSNGQPITLSGTGGMSTVTGGSFPARIWTAFMKGALKGVEATAFPGLPEGQPNGVKPTDSPTPMPTGTVPDVSSDLFYRATGGLYSAAVAIAAQNGFTLEWTSTVVDIDPTTAYVVLFSQDPPATMSGQVGSVIRVEITDTPQL